MIKNKRVYVSSVKLSLLKEKSFLYKSENGKRSVNTPKDAFDLVKHLFVGADREMMLAAHLNIKNEPLTVTTIAVGTLNQSFVHPREVFKAAILSNAAGIILFHNHPSGNLTASKEDREVTKRIKEAGELLGIKLIDHLILSHDDYYLSLMEEKIM